MRHLLGRVARLKVAHEAIEQGRGDSDIAKIGIAIAHRTDVVVHPENLLDDHDRPARRALGLRTIGADLVTVACGQLDMRSHGLSPC